MIARLLPVAGSDGFAAAARILAFTLLTIAALSDNRTIPDDARRAIIVSFLLAFGVAVVVMAIDITAAMPVRRFLMSMVPVRPLEALSIQNGWVVSAPSYLLNKSIAVMMALFWAAMLASLTFAKTSATISWLRRALIAALVVAVYLSDHETSKLSLVLSTILFLVARFAFPWARRLAVAAWTSCVILIVPIALLANSANLQQAPWIQPSAQHRISIWTYASQQILAAPVVGVGIGATRGVEDPGGRVWVQVSPEMSFVVGRKVQPHNIYIQVWNELGGIGAVLLLLTGLAVINRMSRATAEVRPFYFATFATCAVQAGLNWSMNSSWYLPIFAIGALFTVFAADFTQNKSSATGSA